MSEKNKVIETLHRFLDRIKGKDAAGPGCPTLFCNARGVDSIAEEHLMITKSNENSRRKFVLYCRECGHIYKIVLE